MNWFWVWLVVAVVAAIGEAISYELFLASVAASAVIVALVSMIVGPSVQVAVFAALSLLGIIWVRPTVKHALGIDAASRALERPPHPHVVGRRAVVTQRIDAGGGQIRIGQGEFWSARSYDALEAIDVETPVEIVLVEGLTALVEPVQQAALESVSAQKG